MQVKIRFYALLAAAATAFTMATPAQATAVPGQGTWQTTLQARDLDGNGSTDAFYDTALNITWLRNANVNGVMRWSEAMAWVDGFSFGGYADWRLPTMVDTGAPGCDFSFAGGTDCGENVQTATSEMAHLYYVSLGNKAHCNPATSTATSCGGQTGWGLTNTGDFMNMDASANWTATPYAPDTSMAWGFFPVYGLQDFYVKEEARLYAMAVRPGDVSTGHDVPEPQSLLLTLTALAGLSLRRRPAQWRALFR